ncbi:hypothetical protein Tco_0028306 [Tanacetum coccineum]
MPYDVTGDFSYGDQFIDDKPSEANNEKTTADTEAESMVSVTIQQDTSVIPPMTSPVIGPVPRPDSPNVHWPLPTTTTTTSATTNNWASALKTTYVPPPENSLLAQTGDIATFMDWYCKRQGISELTPKDLEGPAYEIVKAFHPDVVHLQFQMEECHKL